MKIGKNQKDQSNQKIYHDLRIGELPEEIQHIFAKSDAFRLIVARIKSRQELRLELIEQDIFVLYYWDVEVYRTEKISEHIHDHCSPGIALGRFIEENFDNLTFPQLSAMRQFRAKQSQKHIGRDYPVCLARLREEYLEYQLGRKTGKLKSDDDMSVDDMVELWDLYDDLETIAAAIPQVTDLQPVIDMTHPQFMLKTSVRQYADYYPMTPAGIFSCFELLRVILAHNDYQAGRRITLDTIRTDYQKIAESRNCKIETSIRDDRNYVIMAVFTKDNSVTVKKYHFAYSEHEDNLYTMINDIYNSEEKVVEQAQSTDAVAFYNEAVGILQQHCTDVVHHE